MLPMCQGNASGAMCSYNSENGHPSCTNGFLLNTVLRERWGKSDVMISTDCGAVLDMVNQPKQTLPAGMQHAPSKAQAAAYTINNGTDLDMGDSVWGDSSGLLAAVSAGLVNETTIDRAVLRTLLPRFGAGEFDPEDQVEWLKLGPESIGSNRSKLVNYEASLQGMVLLKNNGLLPLKKGSNIAVIGPMGGNRDLFSDYAQAKGRAGGCFPNDDNSCVVTIGGAIASMNVGGTTNTSAGVGVTCDNKTAPTCSSQAAGIAGAVAMAKAASVVVLVLGTDRTIEREGVDRPDTVLPGLQSDLAKAVLSTGTPTLLVLSNGGALAIDELVDGCAAIVESFNVGFGADALASLLFGRENRWGRLPVTMYPHEYTTQQNLSNYDMSAWPGRTYKYYSSGTPLYEFGRGLSLTTFTIQCKQQQKQKQTNVTVVAAVAATTGLEFTCTITNTGAMDGDEVTHWLIG